MQISALVIEVSTEWEKRSSKDEFISVNLFLFVSYSIQEEVYIYICIYFIKFIWTNLSIFALRNKLSKNRIQDRIL